MQILDSGFQALILVSAFTLGLLLPGRLGRNLPGFAKGVAAGGALTAFASGLIGILLARRVMATWGILWKALGWMFAGSLIVAFVLSCFFGCFGVLVAVLFRVIVPESEGG
jgi:hypothetical protein